jgi:hypothetical protein
MKSYFIIGVKLIATGSISFFLTLLGSVPDRISSLIYGPLVTFEREAMILLVTSLFMIFFIFNIVWASTRRNKYLLVISPVIYLVIQLFLIVFFPV